MVKIYSLSFFAPVCLYYSTISIACLHPFFLYLDLYLHYFKIIYPDHFATHEFYMTSDIICLLEPEDMAARLCTVLTN